MMSETPNPLAACKEERWVGRMLKMVMYLNTHAKSLKRVFFLDWSED